VNIDVKTLELTDYTAIDGISTFSNSFIQEFWDNLAFKEISFDDRNLKEIDPVKFFRSCRLHIASMYSQVVGGIWIYNYSPIHKRGFMGFGFVNGVRGKKLKFDIAIEGFRQLLNRPDYNMLLGECAKNKRRALEMSYALGFRLIGRIPNSYYLHEEGRFEESFLIYITKETLNASTE
jgi:hypothetical protein